MHLVKRIMMKNVFSAGPRREAQKACHHGYHGPFSLVHIVVYGQSFDHARFSLCGMWSLVAGGGLSTRVFVACSVRAVQRRRSLTQINALAGLQRTKGLTSCTRAC